MAESRRTRAILVTMTTYGTWLRGDRRGWVDDGRILPPDPVLEVADRQRLKHPPFLFNPADLHGIGEALGRSLIARLDQRLLALTIQTWHVHFVIRATPVDIAAVVKCAKDAVRYHLRPGRPIWTDGYDKRFCFNDDTTRTRVRYVERHNESRGLPTRLWPFLLPLD